MAYDNRLVFICVRCAEHLDALGAPPLKRGVCCACGERGYRAHVSAFEWPGGNPPPTLQEARRKCHPWDHGKLEVVIQCGPVTSENSHQFHAIVNSGIISISNPDPRSPS